MSEQGNKSRDVAATVNRLRMLQVDLADESDLVRQEQLSEVIKRALAEIVPEQRQAFLEELRDRFPNWDAGSTGQADQKETITASDMYEDLDDPDFLIEKLTAIAPSLSDDKRQSLAAKLQQSGLASEGRKFSPHITIARFNNPPLNKVAAFMAGHSLFELPPFRAKEFHLYSSLITSNGAVHTIETSYPLKEK